jgi:hypothetical protein
LIVKELYSVLPCCICESFCSSAAEKRDYAVLRLTRQPLVCLVAPSFPTRFMRCKTGCAL